MDAAKALDAAISAVRDGECVVIYPEGTLTRSLDLWPMKGKTGAARVGLATGCPGCSGRPLGHASTSWPKGRRCRVWYHRGRSPFAPARRSTWHPLVADEATPEMLRAATAAIMDSIVTLLAQIRQTSAPPPGGVGEQAPRRDGVN